MARQMQQSASGWHGHKALETRLQLSQSALYTAAEAEVKLPQSPCLMRISFVSRLSSTGFGISSTAMTHTCQVDHMQQASRALRPVRGTARHMRLCRPRLKVKTASHKLVRSARASLRLFSTVASKSPFPGHKLFRTQAALPVLNASESAPRSLDLRDRWMTHTLAEKV